MKDYLEVTVRTFFSDDFTYRNNKVIIPLDKQVAISIANSWRGVGEFSPNNFVAKFLAKNQNADVTLYIDGEEAGGISGMCQQETQDDEFCKA